MNWECDKLLEHEDPFHMDLNEVRDCKFRVFRQAFEHHYTNCPIYKKYCKVYDIEPNDIKSYNDLVKIPPVPSDAFRDLKEPIISVPETEIIFKSTTSSTTSRDFRDV